MRLEHFLIISTLILVAIATVRTYQDSFIPSAKANNVYMSKESPAGQPQSMIELKSISINPESENDFEDFELTGVSICVSDSIYFFDSFTFTPQAGVTVSTNKYFYLDEPIDNPDHIIAITGIYKGTATYFPFRINEIINVDTSDLKPGQYAITIVLKDVTHGSSNHLTPCDPEAMDVKMVSL